MISRGILRPRQLENIARSLTTLSANRTNVLLRRPYCLILPNLANNDDYANVRFQSTESGKDEEQKTLTNAQRLKKAVADYGKTVIVFHVGISLISLGGCYVAVSSGLDVNELLFAIGLKKWAMENSLVSNAGTFAVAYAVHKVFAPVRITITLGSVPFIVKYLRNKGILKK